ncbi:MAG: transglycosylase SLT domain-containing protein [Deltaproteobacteria bacterium]|jgi:membrane-bound lytic murein transglycosylase D|nr:transglycosylase SLT domain-containing protein [Deltaproteobacteria bacterium]
MKLYAKPLLPIVILTAIFSAGVVLSDARADADPFPVPAVIEPNVSFWTKIYTEYSSNHGVLHDSRQLNRIYGVIELVDPDRHGGRKTNQKRIKKAKKKYKAILAKLMQGETPVGPVEQKVAGLFGPDTRPAEFKVAMRNIRCQTGQKDRFRAGVIRSGAYIDQIKRIFQSYGLPEDLSYLPHVESSFNPKAYSKFGAAGMWQFTRSTGKHYMKVGYTIDERRDPLISSYAAAKLLRHNHRKLNSWPLAVTAYNHGVSGMLRAQRKKGTYERIFAEYRSRIFKFASRNFYSEFLAAREAAKNYRHYFGDLKLDSPVKSREVVLKGYVSLPQLVRHLNLKMAELRKLNPALRHPVYRGQKYVPRGYRLRLPFCNDEEWAALVAQIDEKFYKHYQKKSRIYTVQRGDTAGEIARIHGVKLADLMAANNLNSRATIYINQNLRIPLPDETAILIAKQQSKKSPPVNKAVVAPPNQAASIPPQPEKPDTPLIIASQSTDRISDGSGENYRVVEAKHPLEPEGVKAAANARQDEPEESPASLADNNLFVENPMVADLPAPQEGTQPPSATTELESDDAEGTGASEASHSVVSRKVDESALARLTNNQQSRDIKAEAVSEPKSLAMAHEYSEPAVARDMETRPAIPVTESPQSHPEVVLENLVVQKAWNKNGKKVGIIRVEVEETLGHYAEWLNVAAWEIRRLNGFRYGRTLHLNQKIKIPLHRVTAEAFVEKRFEYHQELAEDFFASYRVEKVRTYSIKRGDNIWTLSRQEFEVPLWLIKRYNVGVDFNALVPAQKLIIPIIEKNV